MLTGRRLEEYLAWAIHGRKPELRASSPTRKGPPRDEDYKAWIRTLPCVACGIEGRSEASHTGSGGGMRMKASDYACVPLCSGCQTQVPRAYHRMRKRAFELRLGVSFAGIVAQLNREWRGKCA